MKLGRPVHGRSPFVARGLRYWTEKGRFDTFSRFLAVKTSPSTRRRVQTLRRDFRPSNVFTVFILFLCLDCRPPSALIGWLGCQTKITISRANGPTRMLTQRQVYNGR